MDTLLYNFYLICELITKTFFTETQQNILHKFNFALPNLKIYNGYKYTQNHHKKFKINHKEEK